MQLETLLIVLIILVMYESSPELFRCRWVENEPVFNGAQVAMNNASNFVTIFSFEYNVFMERIVQPVETILNQTTWQICEWLHDNVSVGNSTGSTTKKKKLPVYARMMRLFMVSKKYPMPSLEFMYGQKKSAIYKDAFLCARAVVKVNETEFILPLANTPEYLLLLGQGVLARCFSTAIYTMDGHKIRCQRPKISQRLYYSGDKKYHCKQFLNLHIGNGPVKFIHGGEPGSVNETEVLRRSEFYRNLRLYIAPGHQIITDGQWRHEGDPFLTRFTDREYLTALEMAYNYCLSEARVPCENWYSRLHLLFPILDLWKWRLDKLDVFYRCLSIFTNIHVIHQSPLRTDSIV